MSFTKMKIFNEIGIHSCGIPSIVWISLILPISYGEKAVFW
uniref:Uncharacterized protein n=1 Tax=Rhizophora mucronata TaxID=61149 RepID=A0A2P2L8X4_RHIMU